MIYKKLFSYLLLLCSCFSTFSLSMSKVGRSIYNGGIYYHLLNPASIVYPQPFQIAGFYIYPTKKQRPYWGGTLIENLKIPVAISYINQQKSIEQYLNISTASFLVSGLSLGFSLIQWKTLKDTYWNIKLGTLIKPKRSRFSLGVIGDYLLPLKGPFKDNRLYGIEFTYTPYYWLYLKTDALYHHNKTWSIMGEVKFVISHLLALQTGSEWNFSHKKLWFSGGIGLYTKKVYISYVIKQNFDLHILSIQAKFK